MFLSLTFLNFFPTAMKLFSEQFNENVFELLIIKERVVYPIPFIISLVSYTMMLTLNKVLFFARDFRDKKKQVIKDFLRYSVTYSDDSMENINKFKCNPRKYTLDNGMCENIRE